MALDDVLRQMRQEQDTQLELSNSAAQSYKVNPVAQAGAVKLSQQSGLPVHVFPEMSDDAKLQVLTDQMHRLPEAAPATARFMANPQNAMVAHDDVEQLSGLEGILKGLGRSFSGAYHNAAAGLTSGAASFWGGFGDMADSVAAKSGMQAGGLFRSWQQSLDDSAGYHQGMAANRGIDPESLPGQVYQGGGQALPGLVEWGMGVPLAVLKGYEKDGFAGAVTEGAKRAALGQIFHAIGNTGMGMLQKMGVMGGTMGVQTAAEQLGATGTINPQDLVSSTLVGAILSYQGSGGRADVVRKNLMAGGLDPERANTLAGMVDQSHQGLIADEAKKALDAAATALQGSKLFGRLQDISEQHLGDVVDHHEVPGTVYVPVENLEKLFQGGEHTPETLLSDPKSFYESLATRADVPIPTREFISRFGQDPAYQELTQDVRLAPGMMSAREAQDFANNPEQQKTVHEFLRSIIDEKPAQPAQQVYDDVYGQLLGTGRDRATADKEATLTASVFNSLAVRIGKDPFELYQQYGLKISRPLPDALAKRISVDTTIDPLLDRLRSGDIPSESAVNGPSLGEFLREKGVVDAGGELAAKDVDANLKPFQRKMVREGGLDLDTAREAAVEAGYLPEGSDINGLLDALDGEMRGQPVYSMAGGKQDLADLHLTLSQMKDHLDRNGVDVGRMSNEEIRKALDDGEQTKFFQADTTKRGFLSYGKDRQFEIGFLEKADLSTFLHESGHFYFEVLGDLAEAPDAPEQVKEDFSKILGWFGKENRGEVTVEDHEQFARAFEAYLMEGKAPAVELQSVFQRFKAWLTGVYRDVSRLNAPINDEIRGVFDRLVASDDEIKRAEQYQGLKPLFATAEEAKMSQREFDAYRKQAEEAHAAAATRLQNEMMAELSREQKKWWKEESATVKEEVEAEAKQEPVYRAFGLLAKGELDGEKVEPVKLNRADLVRQYGEDFVKKLPRSFERIYAEGGQDPDIVAEQFGFSSGDEMLKKMMEAPKLSEFVKAETERRMKERHGDMMGDGTLAEKALDAVHSDGQAQILSAELRALKKAQREAAPGVKAAKADAAEELAREKAEREYERRWMEAEKNLALAIERGAKEEEVRQLTEVAREAKKAEQEGRRQMKQGKDEAIPPLSTFRAMAAETIGKTSIRDLHPDLYSRAELKAARATEAAMAKKDFATAAVEKQRQILNHYLYKEAIKAQEEVKAIEKFMIRADSTKTMAEVGKASEELQGQVQNILGRYDFRKLPYAQLDLSLEEFLAKWSEEYDRDIPIDPKVLDEMYKANYREIPLDELRGVYDAVKSIIHVARKINQVIKDGQAVQLDEAKDAMIERVNEMIPKKKEQFLTESAKGRPGSLERFKNQAYINLMNFLESPSRPEFIMEYLDGGKTGPWHDFLWDSYLKANNKKNEYKEMLFPKLKAILDDMPADRKARLYERKHIDALGIPLTRLEMISAALNLGNESNQKKLMLGGIKLGERFSQISPEAVNEIVGHLDGADADLVQGLWSTVESLWPDIAALDKKWVGIEPPKIEATPLMIGGKELTGGYWPVAFDSRHSSFGEKQAQSAKVEQAFGPDFTRASTRKGHTQERTDAAKPLVLDFRSVMTKHIDQVITDLSHREFVDQFNRIIRSGGVKDTLMQSVGEQEYYMLRGWGKSIVNADNYADPSVTGMDKMLRAAKSNLTVAALGLNVAAALADVGITSVTAVARSINPVDFARGSAQFFMHPKETTEFMREKSPAMRHHGMELDQSITQTMDYLSGQNTHRAQVMRFALGMRSWIYHLGTAAGWLSAYKKEMARPGADEAAAIRIADKAVRMTQHAGDVGSLSALERHPLWKHFMMFSGPVVIAYNNMLYGAKEIHQRGATPELLGKIFATWFGQGIAWSLLRGKGPDEDESWGAWLATHAMMGPLEAFPIIRDVLPFAEGKITGKYQKPRELPLYSAVENTVNAVSVTKKWLDGEVEGGKVVKANLSAAGSLAGIPSNQIDVTGTYLYDVLTGQYQPEHPWSPLTDIIYRRKKH